MDGVLQIKVIYNRNRLAQVAIYLEKLLKYLGGFRLTIRNVNVGSIVENYNPNVVLD